MADLPVYFEQRLVGTIDMGGREPGFSYDRRWIDTRGAFPISTTMPLSLALLWQISEALGFCLEAPFRLNRSGEDGADRELERGAADVAFAVFDR